MQDFEQDEEIKDQFEDSPDKEGKDLKLSWTKAEIEALMNRRNTDASNFTIKPEPVDFVVNELEINKLVLSSARTNESELKSFSSRVEE